jgi:hypothetical protein
MFAFQFTAEASDADKDRCIRDIVALQGAIQGIVAVAVGRNQATVSPAYEIGGYVKFIDEQALIDFGPHPVHEALSQWLDPLLAGAVVVDFPTPN